MIVARTIRLALVALVLAVPLAAGEAAIRAQAFRLAESVWPVLWAKAFLMHAAVLWIATGVWVLVFRVLARRTSDTWAARWAVVVAFGPSALWGMLLLNRRLLPDLLERESLIWNALGVAALVGLALVVSAALRRGYAPWWEQGRPSLIGGLVVLVVPALVYLGVLGRERTSEPDVLVILLDVLRADHLGCYGYERPTSPNMDALAQDAIVFENLIAASTYTKTSVASLFTGLAAYHHGVYTGSDGGGSGTIESDLLSDRFMTLAEILRDLDHNTAAWVMNGHVRDYLGYAQGFNYYIDQAGAVPRIAEDFRRWKDEWVDFGRYFAYLHIIDLHGPYDPPAPHHGRFGEPGDLHLKTADVSWKDFKSLVGAKRISLDAADIEELEARYDELICYVDEWVGRIVDDLKATGRYDDTLIIVTSDHGEAFWEHGFIAHSNWPFEELNRVPLIVKMPHSKGAGRRVERMVGHIDLAPTLVEFVGAEPPPGLDGESFLPLLLDPATEIEPRTRFIEYRNIIGVRTERWKYLRSPAGHGRLFDLKADPDELDECSDRYPQIALELDAACDFVLSERAKGKADRVVLDTETIESLQALGYL